MRLLLTIAISFLLGQSCLSQTVQVQYLNKRWEEVSYADKPRYTRTISTSRDSIVTTEVRDLKKEQLLSRQAYKGAEPWGEWSPGTNVFGHPVALDYSFPLIYDQAVCTDTIAGIGRLFADDAARHYKAPVLAEGNSFEKFLVATLVYPDNEREQGTSGKVYLTFRISASGIIGDVRVRKGSGSIALDKEAVRAIRLLRLQSGPMQEGKYRSVCVSESLTFRLD